MNALKMFACLGIACTCAFCSGDVDGVVEREAKLIEDDFAVDYDSIRNSALDNVMRVCNGCNDDRLKKKIICMKDNVIKYCDEYVQDYINGYIQDNECEEDGRQNSKIQEKDLVNTWYERFWYYLENEACAWLEVCDVHECFEFGRVYGESYANECIGMQNNDDYDKCAIDILCEETSAKTREILRRCKDKNDDSVMWAIYKETLFCETHCSNKLYEKKIKEFVKQVIDVIAEMDKAVGIRMIMNRIFHIDGQERGINVVEGLACTDRYLVFDIGVLSRLFDWIRTFIGNASSCASNGDGGSV